MKLVDKFLKTLTIHESDNLVVAVSYGPDSMALLNYLRLYYKENKIICAHVHHNHRKESDIEAKKLENYCSDNNIIFEMMKINSYKNNKFTEAEAREKRYSYFEEVLNKYNSKYLFTAHHGDDLIETVLMKIVRGSTISGYSGINLISKRRNYYIIRPFLYETKDDLLKYCNENRIDYAIDESNDDLIYTRNRYRKNILPILKKENKNVHEKFIEFSNELIKYDGYVNKEVSKIYNNCILNDQIIVDKLKYKDDLVIEKVIRKYLINYYKEDITSITKKHIDFIKKMIKSNKSSISFSMPDNKKLIKDYNKIYFDKFNVYNDYCYKFKDYIKLNNKFIIKKIDKLENNSNYITALDSKELSFPLYVRNRRNGDRVEVLGLNGSKKVKDIFINEKISKSKRDAYPLVVDSKNNIVWIPGIKKTKYDKSKQGKYDIIIKYYKEENDESK